MMEKEWNIIPIKRNSKAPQIKWLEYREKKFPQNELYLYKGKNRAVICGKTSNNLVIIDFDFEEKPYFKNILSILKSFKTRLVATPHGLHAYFYIDGEVPKRTTQIKAKLPELKALDILGEGGYALIPPSTIDDEFYMEINHNKPAKISREYFDKIIEVFSEEKKEDSIENKILKQIVHLREPIQKLIRGEIDIEEISAEMGHKEFKYWKALFLETRANHIPDEAVMGMLAKTQQHFDESTTTIQLRQLKGWEKPYTNVTLNKMFGIKPPPPDDVLEEAWVSIARDLMEAYDVISMSDTKQLMAKRGNIYTENTDAFYKELGEQLIDVYHGKSYNHKRRATLQYIEDSTKFDRKQFCYDRWVINFTNGYYDVLRDQFTSDKNNKNKIFCYEIPHEYHGGKADCPIFKKMLGEWLGEDNVITEEDVFEMMGYTMTMTTHLKMGFMIYGKSNSGKTAFQNILSHLIGIDNISGTPLHRLASNEFGTSGLQFKLLNMSGDMGDDIITNTAVYKNLTGGDIWVHAEYKGGKQYEFRNMVKIWYNVNNVPQVSATHDEAFFTRWALINFPNHFPMRSKNTIKEIWQLVNDNPDEMQGIIHECIAGIKRLIDRNEYFRAKLVKNTEHVWQYESDKIYAFIHDNCITGPEECLLTSEFRQDLNKFLYSLRRPQLTSYKLNTILEEKGVFKERSSSDDRDYYYRGIGWKPKKETEFKRF